MSRSPAAIVWYAWPAAVVAARGPDAVDLLHRLSAQDLRPLADEKGSRDALLVTHQGRLVHRATVWRAQDAVYLRVPAGCGAELLTHLEQYTIVEDVTYTLVGENVACMVVLGADAAGKVPANAVCADGTGGDVLLPAPAALGAGFEWVGAGPSKDVWQKAEHGALLASKLTELLQRPCGAPLAAEAWRVHRLLAGIPAYGDDFLSGVLPFEYRLDIDALAWNQGCYIGQEVLSRLDSYDKVARLLMGLEADAAVASVLAQAAGPIKISSEARPVGRLLSFAPAAEQGVVGLAVVGRAYAQDGQKVVLTGYDAAQVALPQVEARLRHRPFWQARTKASVDA